MELSDIIKGIPQEQRLEFVRKAYDNHPNRTELYEELIKQLRNTLRESGFSDEKEIRTEIFNAMHEQMRYAKEAGDKAREQKLKLDYVFSFQYNQILPLIEKWNDAEVAEAVFEKIKPEMTLSAAELASGILEYLDKGEEAKQYLIDFAERFDKATSNRARPGGVTITDVWHVKEAYLRVGKVDRALQVLIEGRDYDAATNLAKKSLPEDEQKKIFRQIYDSAKANRGGYNRNFPIMITTAENMKDKELADKTKKEYVSYIINSTDDAGWIEYVREFGTKEQLVEMHHRIVNEWVGSLAKRDSWGLTNLIKSASEAYQDTQDKNYAGILAKAYKKKGDYKMALDYARIADPDEAKLIQAAMELVKA